MNERAVEVDSYLERLFTDADGVMKAVERRSNEAGLAAIAISPMQGAFLNILASAAGARRILEIGALGGYSTIWLARALPADGALVTLEIDPKAVETTRANARAAGVDGRIEVRPGAAAETLAAMVADGEEAFDFVFIDADKEGYPAYLERCLELARPGALIVADNVVRKGEILSGAASPAAAGARAYLELAAARPGLRTTVIQTDGVKGHDGLAISLVL